MQILRVVLLLHTEKILSLYPTQDERQKVTFPLYPGKDMTQQPTPRQKNLHKMENGHECEQREVILSSQQATGKNTIHVGIYLRH